MGIEIGALAVRRSVLINATPERVWQEFADIDRMNSWFGYTWEQNGRRGHTLLNYEPRQGGHIELSLTTLEGETRRFGGTIVVFEPARELTFEDAYIPNEEGLPPTYITIRLTPALGGTLVELFHHAFERRGAGAADEHLGHEMGWTAFHLEALRRLVEA